MSIDVNGATKQWYLDGTGSAGFIATAHLNLGSVWSESGGEGITVAIVDDGIETTHSQLAHAISDIYYATEAATGTDGDPASSKYGHGTAVAGIIAAASSAYAPVGIAPEVDLASLRIFGSDSLSLSEAFAYLANYDIANNSWGYNSAFYNADIYSQLTYWASIDYGLQAALDYGRDGLGTIVVKSAGNGREDGRFATDDHVSNLDGVIVVGATDYTGKAAYYSSPGSNLLVSAPSSGAGQGVTTTDRTGSAGYSYTAATDEFGGTSAAAPMVSGVVALILEANPTLTWQEVQDILALSATHTGSAVGVGASGNELYAWQINGATNWNGGGLHFSNDYGFGLVDAYQAVRLAETWSIGRETNVSLEASVSATQWAFDAATSVATAEFVVTSGLDLQSVTLAIGSTIALGAFETVTLVSPDGTTSIVYEAESVSGAVSGSYSWDFLSQAFRGEASDGVWTLEIDFGTNGVDLTDFTADLEISGQAASDNDVYYYTSEFSQFGSGVLADADGIDTLNTAAIGTNVTIDLTPGAFSTLSGGILTLTADTWIEQVVTGDGDDVIVGNDLGNLIWSGEGDDSVSGAGGNDLFFEGLGNDSYDGGDGIDFVFVDSVYDSELFLIGNGEDGSTILFDYADESNILVSVERISFSDGTQIAFDNEGTAGQIYRLYETAFNRTPDEAGYEVWLEAADNGVSLTEIAQSFVSSQEFSELYNGYGTVEEKVAAFYLNSLDREADADGLVGWAAAYRASAIDDSQILIGFSESAENKMISQTVFDDGFIF